MCSAMPEIVAVDAWHRSVSLYQPLRMTIDDAVAGLAQPRLALTSTSLTWRQPPSLVVVGVLALAVGADRAGIVDVVAQLPHVLDHHVHAVGVALAQMAARGVVRPLAAERDRAVRLTYWPPSPFLQNP